MVVMKRRIVLKNLFSGCFCAVCARMRRYATIVKARILPYNPLTKNILVLLPMIYRKQFIKECTLAAIGIFFVLLAILVSTQSINLLGRAADGRVAVDAVAALIGFWTLGMTPLVLVLTAYISILTVLTRYWRDSEMSVWLSSGLSLRQWIRPVVSFALPLAVLVAAVQLAVLPWAELRSREYSEILKQKQNLSMIESGEFRELGKKNWRIYFVEHFDVKKGEVRNLFIREIDQKMRDSVVFAKEGYFDFRDNRRTLVLKNGYRYTGIAGQGDFEQVSFESLSLIINTTPKIVNPIDHRSTIPTGQLIGSSDTQHQSELMWRVSLPLTVLLLGFLAVPLSYFNHRSGNSYHVLLAVVFFLIYLNGLNFLRDAIGDGKIPFWAGLLPMHLLILACGWILLGIRSRPAKPFWAALKDTLTGAKS